MSRSRVSRSTAFGSAWAGVLLLAAPYGCSNAEQKADSVSAAPTAVDSTPSPSSDEATPSSSSTPEVTVSRPSSGPEVSVTADGGESSSGNGGVPPSEGGAQADGGMSTTPSPPMGGIGALAGAGGGFTSGGAAAVGGAGGLADAGVGVRPSQVEAGVPPDGPMSFAEDAEFCRLQLDDALRQYEGYRAAYDDPSEIPRSFDGNTPRIVATSDWTSGFPGGTFWYLYEHSRDETWRTTAEAWTDALYAERNRRSDHDIGFIINNTYGHRLRLTEDAQSEGVLLTSAESLVSRFNPTVGAIRSWDFGSWQYPVIIDNMMNLELLFRVSELSGDASFREIAIEHALTTLANHFRPDGSSYHVVDYSLQTGAVLAQQTNQGLADESAWARGQAWGLYGYTMCYRETEDERFLEQAIAIADFYTLNAAMPADGVPYFDFDAPERNDVPDLRDASAGAIATSALLELSGYAPDGERYRSFALDALRSLSSADYRAAIGENGHFLLQHSVGNYPIGDELDVALNYADYYYVEALLRCSRLE